MPLDERVLVIPASRFHEAGSFHGFRADTPELIAALLDPRAYQFRPRSEVETDPAYKQLIPYVLLRHEQRLFHYRRGSSGTEKRLQALRSVGIGGHISEADARGGGDVYRAGMLRELEEEVVIGCAWSERLLGFINDDRTPVGRVHLGVVHLLDLTGPDVCAREAAIADGGFAPIAELRSKVDEYETWSQFVLAYVPV